MRFLAAALTAACLVGGVFGVSRLRHEEPAVTVVARQAPADAGATSTTTHRVARRSFLGGTYVTANGGSVTVRVSESFADADERGRRWAEFFSTLPHGDELARVQITVVTAAELPGSCGDHALGCYRPGDLSFADEVIAGVSSEEVARHEYGHHVAANRLNTPWPALDWGPKRWASVAGVCSDVNDGLVFPGDEGSHYSENPAEVWAEVYRILAERAAGLPGNLWSIVVGRYYPDDLTLAAAREDVFRPWTAPTQRPYSGRFVKGGKRIWQRTVATPRDGNIVVKLSMPAGPRHNVTLLAADGRSVIARWTSFTARTRTISTTICGQRSVLLRVTQGVAPGPFVVSVTAP